ncbi:hypothetical protein PHLGIDRAFT_86299 [Phlebiopsis gigantea 11061_1 CR5-6]|uniref:Uncharacterized protein n=1 Tax=Phlebiopsis gigantea (strain 11061_1 CR5-6) TaxID=745531 RepID=A0A0C3SDI4_PHLG1|nr:hypothetical protein PHLGIDRAFT_86299 [Phlebiopsis gigantea 11061_1 CR5-6]
MGRSAKFLKRAKKLATSSGQREQKPTAVAVVSEQKKKASLKAKAAKRKGPSEGHVLGGADYVELLMGSRKKAREESTKLPKSPDA